MLVKGVAFLTRVNEIRGMVSEERWTRFFDSLKKERRYFQEPVFQSSRIPLADFLVFQEMAIDAFFDSDPVWYWILGKNSAKWSFSEGPFKSALADTDFNSFVNWGPSFVWKSYYDFGKVKAWLEDSSTLHAQLLDLPERHPHFEFGSMGFIEGTIEVFRKQAPYHKNVTPPEQQQMVYYVFKF